MTERMEFSLRNEAILEKPFRYTLSGLPDVYLLNGVEFSEDTGYGTTYKIAHLRELHEAIALALALRPNPMRGDQLRFIRKQLGYSQGELASRLHVSDQTVANYEKGHTDIPWPTELLVRAFYLLRIPTAQDLALKLLQMASDPKSDMPHISAPSVGDWETREAA